MKLKDLKSFLRYYFFLFFVKNNPYLTCQYCFPSHGNSFQSVNECRCNKQKQLDQNNNEEHKKSSGIGSGILAGAVTGGIVNILNCEISFRLWEIGYYFICLIFGNNF